jgi:hypothetical protein
MTTFPSAPVVLADALYRQFGSGSTKLTYPLDLPAIQVTRQGGGDDGITDAARVEVIVIAASEAETETLSEEIRSFLLDGPVEGAGKVIDKVRTEVAPRRVPYPDDQQTGVTEYVGSYVATARQQ